jgi:ribonuclease P protein component
LIPGPPDRPRFTLPADRRIRRKRDFDAIHASGRRLGNGHFGAAVRASDGQGARLGLAVSLKVSGTGVERNRIRRAIRESFRQVRHDLPAVDLVVSARGRARGAPGGELRASLADLWLKVRQMNAGQRPC